MAASTQARWLAVATVVAAVATVVVVARSGHHTTTARPVSRPQPSPAVGAPVSAVPTRSSGPASTAPSTTRRPAPPGGGGSACASPNYPTAACTGVPAGTTLKVVAGDLTVSTPNTVVEGKEIRGCVVVRAPGVVIRKSRIVCPGSAVFNEPYAGTWLLLEDVEISCGRQTGTGVSDRNFTARRMRVHDCANGFYVDANAVIEDSFIYDFDEHGPDPHTDGVQVPQHAKNITIRHNTIHAFSTVDGKHGNSAITNPKTVDGLASDVLIQNNLLAGGSYTLYCVQGGPGQNFRVVGNRFSTRFSGKVGAFGPWLDCADETQVSGNVYHETGKALPP